MNKKGIGPVGVLASWFMFFIVWVFWLNTTISYWGQFWITTYNVVGIEAFFLSNLNFFVLLCSLLGAFIGVVSTS